MSNLGFIVDVGGQYVATPGDYFSSTELSCVPLTLEDFDAIFGPGSVLLKDNLEGSLKEEESLTSRSAEQQTFLSSIYLTRSGVEDDNKSRG